MKKSLTYLEQALTESKEIFKIVFEHSPEAITVTDKEERIVAWNPMAEKLLGMKKKDLFNKLVQELYPVEEWKRMRGLNIRKAGWLSDIDTKVIRKDGTLLDVSASISVLKDTKTAMDTLTTCIQWNPRTNKETTNIDTKTENPHTKSNNIKKRQEIPITNRLYLSKSP